VVKPRGQKGKKSKERNGCRGQRIHHWYNFLVLILKFFLKLRFLFSDLALTNWDSLSPIVSKETIKKWVIDGIKQTFNNKGRSTKVLNLAEKDPEDAVK
jgi:hypothetical protein